MELTFCKLIANFKGSCGILVFGTICIELYNGLDVFSSLRTSWGASCVHWQTVHLGGRRIGSADTATQGWAAWVLEKTSSPSWYPYTCLSMPSEAGCHYQSPLTPGISFIPYQPLSYRSLKVLPCASLKIWTHFPNPFRNRDQSSCTLKPHNIAGTATQPK